MVKISNQSIDKKNNKENKKYTRQDLQNAIDDVNNNQISVYKASKRYNVPCTTIRNHVEEKSLSTVRGKPTTFTNAEEKIIADYIFELSKIGFALDFPTLQQIVKNYVSKTGLVTPFQDNKPGKDWIYG